MCAYLWIRKMLSVVQFYQWQNFEFVMFKGLKFRLCECRFFFFFFFLVVQCCRNLLFFLVMSYRSRRRLSNFNLKEWKGSKMENIKREKEEEEEWNDVEVNIKSSGDGCSAVATFYINSFNCTILTQKHTHTETYYYYFLLVALKIFCATLFYSFLFYSGMFGLFWNEKKSVDDIKRKRNFPTIFLWSFNCTTSCR